MKFRIVILFICSSIAVLLLLACKLTIMAFTAPDLADSGSPITLTIKTWAEAAEDGASEHGVVLQIPEDWMVVHAQLHIHNFMAPISEKEGHEHLYTPRKGNKIWVGAASRATIPGYVGPITFSIRVITSHFDGEPGDLRAYNHVKAALGVFRSNAWDAEDPPGVFDFRFITDDLYVEEIIVMLDDDQTPPQPVSTLTVRDKICPDGVIHLYWEEAHQEDVVSYRIYHDTAPFTDVSEMTPVGEAPIGVVDFQFVGALHGVHYFAVTAVDEMLNENQTVTPTPIFLQLCHENFETGDLNWFPWVASGDGAWFADDGNPYCGEYSATSPLIDHLENAELSAAVTCEDGVVSFWLTVSSEENADFVSFYVDDVLQGSWSGAIDYSKTTYSVTAGEREFKWRYSKNDSNSVGSDSASIDYITFPFSDIDGDGAPDDLDGCPDDPNKIFRNEYYQDRDGDGFGDPVEIVEACEPPSGYVSNNADCDDEDVHARPDQIWRKDADGDGFSDGAIDAPSCARPPGFYAASELTDVSGDCNDNDPYEHPNQIWCKDADGDGYSDGVIEASSCTRPLGYYTISELIDASGDCNDSDPYEHPNQTWCKDADGDGYSDGVIDRSSCTRPHGYYTVSELTATSGDPDDNDPSVYPGHGSPGGRG